MPAISCIIQALLRSICKKVDRSGEDRTWKYLSFLQDHSLDPIVLSPIAPFRRRLRPPKAVFEDLWWTLGRNRVDSDEPMGMISIAVCMLRCYERQLPDATCRCLISILHLGDS
jgi:hypothetical protein